ncbi:MAG: MarR family transcriptional regulator [Deltaproteobacteria bacterium]|nr:MarR family transcriptional regulator [Deltaproteobacteria bacterium]
MPPAADPPDDSQRFLDAMRRIVQALRVADRQAHRSAGLSGAQLFVLRCLQRAAQPLDLRTLAERTRTHHSSVSVVVQRLVEHGLVTRTSDPHDARRAAVQLSPLGRRALRTAPAAPQQALVEHLEALPAATRRRLAREMIRLAAAVAPADAPAPMFFDTDKPERAARRRA